MNLLIFKGSEFQVSAPNTLNIIRETENHILLKIGSKYLKNKFIKEIEHIKNFYEGNPEKFLGSGISEKLAEFEYDNEDNGLKEKLLFYLETLSQCGLYEFNSKPYFAYSVRGLLNLEAFGDKEVRIKARHALDHIFYMTAIGSLDFKCYPPLRRLKNTSNQEMLYDYRSVFMAAWEGLDIEGLEGRNKHKLIAAVSNYRPPLRTVLLMHDKGLFTFPSQGLTSSKNKSNLLEASKNDSWSEFLKGFEYEMEPLQNKVDDFAEKEGKDSPRDAARVIQYDVKSPKSTWVIKSDNKRKFLNRDMDRWPLLTTFGKVYKNESSDLEKSGITKI